MSYCDTIDDELVACHYLPVHYFNHKASTFFIAVTWLSSVHLISVVLFESI